VIGPLVCAALVLTVDPPRLAQQQPPATAKVHVSDGNSPPAKHLHLWSSTGNISNPLDLGGGHWEAIYTAPHAGRPQFAVIAAWDEDSGVATAVTLPLEGRTEFPADTDPGARVQVEVGAHRGSGHADDSGHARVTTWVAPEAHTAKITAVDPAGNTTVEEVKLEPAPGGVWLVAPPELAEGVAVRVFAFATGGAPIKLRARNGDVQVEQDEAGVLVAKVSARDHVKLVATADPGRASAELRYHPNAPPPPPRPSPAPSPAPLPPRVGAPRWEVGATVNARYSGEFSGVGVAVEYRHKLRRRWHFGVDLLGGYAEGNAQSTDVVLGAVGARGVAELRLGLGPLVMAVFHAAVGGVYLYEQRTPTVGMARSLSDGTLTLALGAGFVARAGHGIFVLRAEYAWTPILRLGLANVDGGTLSVGYRYGRW
jgi:hypothetical protein